MKNVHILFLFLAFLSFLHVVCEASSLERHIYASAVNDFALNFHRILTSSNDKKENLFYSPYSIYTALAMVELAADGNTCKQLTKTMYWLRFSGKDKQNNGHQAFRGFNELVLGDGKTRNPDMSVANKLWLQKYFGTDHLTKYFLPRMKKFYNAEIGIVNFIVNEEDARQSINKWVAEHTNFKIKNLIKPGMLSSSTRLVLSNAVYFRGTWKTRFNENKTIPMKFTIDKNRSMIVPMMLLEAKVRYTENSRLKAIELPYGGDRMSMIVIVPKGDISLEELEQSLRANTIRSLIVGMTETDATVRIPKFKMEDSHNLKEHLRKLGIIDLFDQFEADLSWVLGVRGLFLSDIVHKAYVDVNEKGTEAAATTSSVDDFEYDPDKKFLLANRPFLFAIRNKDTGVFLFIGRVIKPSGYAAQS